MQLIKSIALALLLASPAFASPNQLTPAERHELDDMRRRAAEIEDTLARLRTMLVEAHNAEAREVETRIRAAHAMKDGDMWDLSTGQITRKPPEKPKAEPAKK